MKLYDKLYCDICYKCINITVPEDITYCYSYSDEVRHYCRDHCDIGEMKLYEICRERKYKEKLKDFVMTTPYISLHEDN